MNQWTKLNDKNTEQNIKFAFCCACLFENHLDERFRFPCEVRIRSTPLLPCRRHGKKRNGKDVPDDDPEETPEETAPPTPAVTPAPPTPTAIKKEPAKKSAKNPSSKPVNIWLSLIIPYVSLFIWHGAFLMEHFLLLLFSSFDYCFRHSNSWNRVQIIRYHELKHQAPSIRLAI